MNTSVVGDLTGELLGGRYLIVKPLARGGMATVFLATDTKLQRTVAVKVLKPALAADPDFLERFKREAQSTAKLWNPNVVAVFDWDVDEQPPYLVLEYVPGFTLRDLLANGRLTPAQALAVLEPVLEALSAAHDAGIVHRDIKPENVLIGPRQQVKVADFGLARAHDDAGNATKSGLVMATPAYMSPEQVAGTRPGTASDIYSTGILLFEMLTGRQPYSGDNPASVAFQHVNSQVPRPSAVEPGLPTELDDLVLGATDREVAGRFASVTQFLDEVRQVRRLMPPATRIPDPPAAANDTVILDPPPVQVPDVVGDLSTDWDDETPPEAPVPRRRRRRIALVVVALVALVAGLLWAYFDGPLQRATVPNLVGLSQAEAEALLGQSQLRLSVDSETYSETAPKGTVISQDPGADAGTFVRFPVDVVISKGPERYKVPNVAGKSPADATAALEGTKLKVAGQSTAFHETIAKGLVVSTDPPAGTSLKPQTAVKLIISDGPAPRPVPDVLGQPSDEAKAAVEGAGLEAQLNDDYSEQYDKGTIASVNPNVGTKVAKGSTVTLTVSKGPPPVEVPRVVDMKKADAIAQLESLGFKVNVKQGIITPLDRVYSQDPGAGTLAPKGSTVSISIF